MSEREKYIQSENESTKRPEISRRQFLGLFAGALAAGALLSGKEKSGVEAQEVQAETYQERLRKIRDESWYIPREQVYTYKRAKNGIEIWQKFKEGNTTFFSIPLENLQGIYDDNIETIELFHTHTLSHMYPEFSDRDKARSGELPFLAMHPSLMDVIGAISAIDRLGKNTSAKLKFKVADPGRVWDYTPDPANPFFEKVLRFQKQIQSLKWQDREDVRKFIKEHNLENEDPRDVFMQLVGEKQKFTKKTQVIIEQAVALGKEFMDENIRRIDEIENSPQWFPYGAPELQELIDRYRSIGVNITSIPYP